MSQTPNKDEKPKAGTVAEMRAKFDKKGKASTPTDYAKQRDQLSNNARAQAALYNMQLRGAQVHAKNSAAMKRPVNAANGGSGGPKNDMKPAQEVTFEVHEFTEEWQEYPWHLAAAFVDDDDAFWVPELALALEKDDEKAINEAVLRFFFEEHDQARLEEIDELLFAHAGREDALFVELSQAYASSSANGGEEAKTDQPPPPPKVSEENRRRPSFIVSGMRKGSNGFVINAQNDDLKSKMMESGATEEMIETVVKVAGEQGTAVVQGDEKTAEGDGTYNV